jgi:hypothetical protein
VTAPTAAVPSHPEQNQVLSWRRRLARGAKHPRFMPYNRLIALCLTVNLMILGHAAAAGWYADVGSVGLVGLVAQVNFAIAIVVRQQHVINAVCRLATRVPTTWPLGLRASLAKIHHLGGVHVGSALAGTLWYITFVVALGIMAVRRPGSVWTVNVVLSSLLAGLFMIMIAMARPSRRARKHDTFEATHRFLGWLTLVLVWANTVLFVLSRRDGGSVAGALLSAPTVWIILLTTASSLLPWLRLRRVPVDVERPSAHVAMVHFDHGVTPFTGSVRPISRHPLHGWHTFGNLPGTNGYRMVISRAGDWTSRFIDDPPSHVWVRGVPTAGMANVRKLFHRVVYVATGSGIGPLLAHLLVDEVPSHLVWATRDPRATYGDALVDDILRVQPDATIWNTTEHGKPDMLALALAAYRRTGAEAVICVANKEVTGQVVHGLERLGIPAMGPIWDS